jgi:hypothetical protein
MGKPVRDNIRRNLGEHDQAKQNKRYIEGQYPVHNSFYEWHAKLCHTNRKMPPRKENKRAARLSSKLPGSLMTAKWRCRELQGRHRLCYYPDAGPETIRIDIN